MKTLHARLYSYIFVGVALILLCGSIHSPAYARQTREQCNRCCTASHEDEYYREQCKLRCFRDHDSCTDSGAQGKKKSSTTAPEHRKPPERVKRLDTQRSPEKHADAARPSPKQRAFHFPNPLNLTPGREAAVAGELTTLNGIPPHHPNHVTAAQAIERVLIRFVKTHPTGGRLPTTQLEAIITKYR